MSRADAPLLRSTPALVGRRVLDALRWLSPPTRSVQFWIVQVGVVGVAVVHDYLLDDRHDLLPFRYPPSLTVLLLLVPIIYAALNFGVRGSVATGLWATALMIPDILFFHSDNTRQAWIEASILIVLDAVAVVVGQRVEHERRARRRAEAALHGSERAELRYRALFEGHHSPILLVDGSGRTVEANSAAQALFDSFMDLAVSGVLPAGLLSGHGDEQPPRPVQLQGRDGPPRWFLPSVRSLPIGGPDRLTQIVLTDVTAERHREEEQRAYAASLIHVQEEERRRLARDLHDDPLQALTFLTRSLRELLQTPGGPARADAELARDADLAEQTAATLREIIRGLRPPILDDLGLVPALRHLATEVRQRCGLQVDVHVRGTVFRLAPEVELALFRVTQEALTNTVHHAKARRAVVTLDFSTPLALTVHDDGVGVGEAPSGPLRVGGMGIPGMQERVAHVGGSLTVSSAPGGGTIVAATLPGDPGAPG